MAIGTYLAYREALRQRLNPDHVFNMILLIIPATIIGARLYYVIFNWNYFFSNPIEIIRVWNGGLAVHGGIIAGVIVVWLYTRHHKIGFLRWTDIFAPSLALGQAIGRWGNFFNQEAYGYETSVPWAMFIDGAYRHPTFLYESICNVLIFVMLMWLIRRRHRIGTVFAAYLVSYSAARFFIEMFRTDSLMLGSLRAAMLISAICIVIGVGIMHIIRKQEMVDVALLPQEGASASSNNSSTQRSGAGAKKKKKKKK
jgi:phosphatidylglycerol:prolipoprotein diacylglycerol transferase